MQWYGILFRSLHFGVILVLPVSCDIFSIKSFLLSYVLDQIDRRKAYFQYAITIYSQSASFCHSMGSISGSLDMSVIRYAQYVLCEPQSPLRFCLGDPAYSLGVKLLHKLYGSYMLFKGFVFVGIDLVVSIQPLLKPCFSAICHHWIAGVYSLG